LRVKTNRHGAKKRQDRQQSFCFETSFKKISWRGGSWRRGGSILVGAALMVACAPKCREPLCPTATAQASASASTTPLAPAPTLAGKVVSPGGSLPAVTWSDEELGKDVAIKTVRQSDGASHHVVRLLKAEKPHVHDRSDLVVIVLSGSVRMHFGDRVVPVGPGQIIDIPKGEPHWAENASAEPSFAYVVFAPAFDGKDRRPVDDPGLSHGAPH
jgi:mannose-6-phosphate isomerase-like protein (cupin superfamily)